MAGRVVKVLEHVAGWERPTGGSTAEQGFRPTYTCIPLICCWFGWWGAETLARWGLG